MATPATSITIANHGGPSTPTATMPTTIMITARTRPRYSETRVRRGPRGNGVHVRRVAVRRPAGQGSRDAMSDPLSSLSS